MSHKSCDSAINTRRSAINAVQCVGAPTWSAGVQETIMFYGLGVLMF